MNRFNDKKPYGTTHPWMKPEVLSRLHAEIEAACDEMERMKVKRPTAELVGKMTDRIWGSLRREFPEMERYARAYDHGMHAQGAQPVNLYGIEMQNGGFFAGLIALLLLAGFFGRRNLRGRY